MNEKIEVRNIDVNSDMNTNYTKKRPKIPQEIYAYEDIKKIPIQDILSDEEIEIYEHEMQKKIEVKPLGSNKLVVVTKATRLCNLRCSYCHSWAEGKNNTMSFSSLVAMTKRILDIPDLIRIEFVWHGGEVTRLRPEFFIKFIWLQQHIKRDNQFVTNAIQTNAVNISEKWIALIKRLNISVGISLDGHPEINDSRRVDLKGIGTSKRIEKTIQTFRNNSIKYGGLVVVDRLIFESDKRELLDYFAKINLNDLVFLDIVPDNRLLPGESPGDSYINYFEYMDFLSELFLIWWKEYKDIINIPLFNSFVGVLKGASNVLMSCYWSEKCHQEVVTIEPNATVSACDKYVGSENFYYGSLLDNDLKTLLESSIHYEKSEEEEIDNNNNMRNCQWFNLCHGGCPQTRISNRKHNKMYSDTLACCGTDKLLNTISGVL